MWVYLFRHGRTKYNLEHRYQGRTDLPLLTGETGRLEKGRLLVTAGIQGPVNRVYVSPALRARQTAGIYFPDAEQVVMPDLMEMDFGIFEGRTADEMRDDRKYREWVDSMCMGPVPGGESKADYIKRVGDCFCGIVSDQIRLGEGSIAIVAHGGTQMAVMDEFCTDKRSYWEWQTQPGEGLAGVLVTGRTENYAGNYVGDMEKEKAHAFPDRRRKVEPAVHFESILKLM